MTFIDFLNKGGLVTYILFVANIFGYATIFYKAWSFWNYKKNINKDSDQLFINFQNKMSTISISDEGQIALLKEDIVQNVKVLEPGLNTLKILATTGPLMGLLGTVIGILEAFSVISQSGMGDPALFANAISLSLINTVSGLAVAIPHLVAYNYFISALDSLELELQDLTLAKFTKTKMR